VLAGAVEIFELVELFRVVVDNVEILELVLSVALDDDDLRVEVEIFELDLSVALEGLRVDDGLILVLVFDVTTELLVFFDVTELLVFVVTAFTELDDFTELDAFDELLDL